METSSILDCARDLAVLRILISDGSILSPFRGKADRQHSDLASVRVSSVAKSPAHNHVNVGLGD